MNTKLFHQLDLTNLLTLSGLLFSLLAAIFAIEGQFYGSGFHMPKGKPKQQGRPKRYIVLPMGALILAIIYGVAMFS